MVVDEVGVLDLRSPGLDDTDIGRVLRPATAAPASLRRVGDFELVDGEALPEMAPAVAARRTVRSWFWRKTLSSYFCRAAAEQAGQVPVHPAPVDGHHFVVHGQAGAAGERAGWRHLGAPGF